MCVWKLTDPWKSLHVMNNWYIRHLKQLISFIDIICSFLNVAINMKSRHPAWSSCQDSYKKAIPLPLQNILALSAIDVFYFPSDSPARYIYKDRGFPKLASTMSVSGGTARALNSINFLRVTKHGNFPIW